MTLYIGTSGWCYQHWKNVFYPRDINSKDFLKYYAEYFATVEINNSFYKMPTQEVLKEWLNTVPKNFKFSVKASRYITHMKKLKDPSESLVNLFKAIKVLDDKLGPILFQLPPRWRCNLQRLDSFCKLLPKSYKYVFEFRDTSWFNIEVYDLLKEHNIALCIYNLNDYVSPLEVTADFIYVRLHGPGDAYKGKYNYESLRSWAEIICKWNKSGKEVSCYFNNDELGYAAQNALELSRIIK
ncbi:DUF72 domain-containing protein [bacterium]